MKLHLDNKRYFDTELGLDVSIPISAGINNVNAWYCSPVKIEPVMTTHFIGDVNNGGVVNFNNISFNPHGNGTHTECVGHISSEKETINQCMKAFHFMAQVISVTPAEIWNEKYQVMDMVITKEIIKSAVSNLEEVAALLIRTLPNNPEKKTHQYSNTNPPFFDREAITLINALNIQHLLVDLPSVDREVDEGKLLAHREFWNYPENPSVNKTITELIYIPNEVKDGVYLLNFGITSLESDASPSKIMLYEVKSS